MDGLVVRPGDTVVIAIPPTRTVRQGEEVVARLQQMMPDVRLGVIEGSANAQLVCIYRRRVTRGS